MSCQRSAFRFKDRVRGVGDPAHTILAQVADFALKNKNLQVSNAENAEVHRGNLNVLSAILRTLCISAVRFVFGFAGAIALPTRTCRR